MTGASNGGTLRAALYLRVSTARQAKYDVSIPDQHRQGETWCAAHGYELVETFVDAGVRRPATVGPSSSGCRSANGPISGNHLHTH